MRGSLSSKSFNLVVGLILRNLIIGFQFLVAFFGSLVKEKTHSYAMMPSASHV